MKKTFQNGRRLLNRLHQPKITPRRWWRQDSQHPGKLRPETVDLLVSILASEAGNPALKVLAALWSGGIALHLGKLLQTPQFVQTFLRKGCFKPSMEHMPIHTITPPAALLGAATFGLQSLRNLKSLEETKSSPQLFSSPDAMGM